MPDISISYLNGKHVAELAMTDGEIIAAVESGLRAQGNGETVIEPRVHLVPESSDKGHFNVLRGYIKPLGFAGFKMVGDFVDNYKRACRRRWRSCACSIPRPACRARSSMPRRSRKCAPAR